MRAMILQFLDFLKNLTDPERLIALLSSIFSGWWAYLFLFGIIFAETGLLAGFIFPGDSLLFTLGVVAGAGELNVYILIGILILATISGDTFGYFLGKKTGPLIFSRPDSRFFKQEYVYKTKNFYDKYGGKAIIYARFIPVIRSFTPFIVGVVQMPYRKFIGFSVTGATLWVLILTLLGYFLGNVDFVRQNFEKTVLLIILLSISPGLIEYIKHRRQEKNA